MSTLFSGEQTKALNKVVRAMKVRRRRLLAEAVDVRRQGGTHAFFLLQGEVAATEWAINDLTNLIKL